MCIYWEEKIYIFFLVTNNCSPAWLVGIKSGGRVLGMDFYEVTFSSAMVLESKAYWLFFLMFVYLLYNSGGWDSAVEGVIHTQYLSLSTKAEAQWSIRRRGFAGRSRGFWEMHCFESHPQAVYLMV